MPAEGVAPLNPHTYRSRSIATERRRLRSEPPPAARIYDRLAADGIVGRFLPIAQRRRNPRRTVARTARCPSQGSRRWNNAPRARPSRAPPAAAAGRTAGWRECPPELPRMMNATIVMSRESRPSARHAGHRGDQPVRETRLRQPPGHRGGGADDQHHPPGQGNRLDQQRVDPDANRTADRPAARARRYRPRRRSRPQSRWRCRAPPRRG